VSPKITASSRSCQPSRIIKYKGIFGARIFGQYPFLQRSSVTFAVFIFLTKQLLDIAKCIEMHIQSELWNHWSRQMNSLLSYVFRAENLTSCIYRGRCRSACESGGNVFGAQKTLNIGSISRWNLRSLRPVKNAKTLITSEALSSRCFGASDTNAPLSYSGQRPTSDCHCQPIPALNNDPACILQFEEKKS